MPLILLGAAAVAATTYLVPLIISCVVGAVTVIVTFVGTRAYYANSSEDDVELQDLKEEQAKNDAAIRNEMARIASETGVDIQKLLAMSKNQQAELKKSIHSFMQNIEKNDELKQSFSSIVDSLQETSTDANVQQKNLHAELERMKAELVSVNQKLSETAQDLADKEAKLQQTIRTLADFENKVNGSEILNQLESLQKLGHLNHQQGGVVKPQMDSEKDAEILALRTKNSSLSQTVDNLTGVVHNLQTNIKNRTATEQLQIQEIQKLIIENKRMTATIESLTKQIAENNSKASQLTTSAANQLKLFG